MADNDAAEVKKASGEALDVTGKPLKRLLLCETLLEEYDSLDQPPLDNGKLQTIRAEINERRKTLKDACEETALGGEMMRRIYRLINEAQTKKADQIHKASGDKPESTSDGADKKVAGDGAIVTKGNGDGDGSHQRGTGVSNQSIMPTGKNLTACAMRSALCLSGGGVRSATFNLGILQGLARYGLLEKFDYLSTVSGGGFIGGWLSAWIRRAGMTNVVNDLKKPPATPLTPDPAPVEHLRIYSNYLSPQPGLLSADTWTLVASVVRNLVLNWLVFVPVLLGFLLLPRLWSAIVLRSSGSPSAAMLFSLIVGSVAAFWALANIGLMLPSSNDYSVQSKAPRYKAGQGPFIRRCLTGLVVSAAALAVYFWSRFQPGRPELEWYFYALFMAVIGLFSWAFCFLRIHKITKKRDARYYFMIGMATVLIVAVVPAIAGYIAYSAITSALVVFQKDTYHVAYSVFSVPLILLLMSLQALLIAGFTSRFSKDEDQEWWARAGAWVLIIVIAWTTVHLLVLYGPLLLLYLETVYSALKTGGLRKLEWADWGNLLGIAAGIVSGVITIFGGVSAKTPANSKEAQKAGTGGLLLGIATQVLAPVFLAFLIILLSLGTNFLLISWPCEDIAWLVAGVHLPEVTSPWSKWHLDLIQATPTRLLVIVLPLLILLGAVFGRLISTNVFSLQYLWRNRIIRAYLGASHPDRDPDPFTGFDTYDNLQMHELWPQPGKKNETYTKRADRPDADADKLKERDSRKLFHILNMALNLTGGEKLQWQDRKAESFTVSPLHAGSYWLGYRRSTDYGGDDGITLGASIAISGAFVSPNMGFMMTSPVVRFLMAVFNVRFGWWLGNPGPAGDTTNIFERLLKAPARMLGFEVKLPFQLDSPRLSVIPFLSEAFGNTDDKSPYVYLSDGGHFENLGLYEMVLRRCRFIVVCDATTDPDYSFESLAMSIRQIRVDLGIPIDIPEMGVGVPSQNLKSKYCAMGRIRYSCVDKKNENDDNDEYDGVLIFIKPSLIGQEPRDVINYWQGRASFPQEAITDQWFSEAQFESYRALASYIIDAICGEKNKPPTPMTLEAFAQKARDHNLLNFDAFREQIGLVALEDQFKKLMEKSPVTTYEEKVREFMKRVLG